MNLRKNRRKMTTPRIIALAFGGAVLLGALLLMLPIAAADGQGTNFLDALFTSTTSICVTGLVTLETAAHWSLFGKVIILALIQMGGLGVITVTMFIFVLLRRHITLRERLIVQSSYNLDTPQGMVRMIMRIVKGTFLVEGIGAGLYMTVFIPRHGIAQGFWYAVFHAISAFCNAGLDIIGPDSLAPFVTNPIVNLTTMFLIVTGGIGFPVWWDLMRVWDQKKRRKKRDGIFSSLTLHTKMAISITLFLIISGTVLVLVMEYNNPETIGKYSFGNKLMASLFHSVTLRTAGFFTISPAYFRQGTMFLSILFMIIGGSPAGTAGGIKTTTVGMVFFMALAQVRGKKDAEIFGRRISSSNLRTGITVITVSLVVFFTSVTVLCCTEQQPFLDIFFESASAVGTVGLSRGITAGLSRIGKVVIILTMYMGRIGPITMATALALGKGSDVNLRELPEQKVLIG